MAGDTDIGSGLSLPAGKDGQKVGEPLPRQICVTRGAELGHASSPGKVALGTEAFSLMGGEFLWIECRHFAGCRHVLGGGAVTAFAGDSWLEGKRRWVETRGVAIEAAGFDHASKVELGAALEARGKLPLGGFGVVRNRGLKEAIALREKKAMANTAGTNDPIELASPFEGIWLAELQFESWGDAKGRLSDGF